MKNKFKNVFLAVLFIGIFAFSLRYASAAPPPVGISSTTRSPTSNPIDQDTAITFSTTYRVPFNFPPLTVDWVRLYYEVGDSTPDNYIAMALDGFWDYDVTRTSVQLGAGENETIYWYCKGKDSDGGTAQSSTYNYKTASDNPTITNIDHTPTYPNYNQDVTVSCTATDPTSEIDWVKARYKVYGDSWTAWQTCSNPSGDTYQYTFSDDWTVGDVVHYQFYAMDTAENYLISEYSVDYKFDVIDTVAPVLSGLEISPDPATYYVDTTCKVTVTDEDGFGVEGRWQLESEGWSDWIECSLVGGKYEFTIDESNFVLGDSGSTVYFEFYAEDTSTNSDTADSSFILEDVTAPIMEEPFFDTEVIQKDQITYIYVTGTDENEIVVNTFDYQYREDGTSTWYDYGGFEESNSTHAWSVMYLPDSLIGKTVEFRAVGEDIAENVGYSNIVEMLYYQTSHPSITETCTIPAAPHNADYVTVQAQVTTWNTSVDTVIAKVKIDAGDYIYYEMVHMGNDVYEWTSPSYPTYGNDWLVYVWANNTEGDFKQSSSLDFTIVDITAPSITNFDQFDATLYDDIDMYYSYDVYDERGYWSSNDPFVRFQYYSVGEWYTFDGNMGEVSYYNYTGNATHRHYTYGLTFDDPDDNFLGIRVRVYDGNNYGYSSPINNFEIYDNVVLWSFDSVIKTYDYLGENPTILDYEVILHVSDVIGEYDADECTVKIYRRWRIPPAAWQSWTSVSMTWDSENEEFTHTFWDEEYIEAHYFEYYIEVETTTYGIGEVIWTSGTWFCWH